MQKQKGHYLERLNHINSIHDNSPNMKGKSQNLAMKHDGKSGRLCLPHRIAESIEVCLFSYFAQVCKRNESHLRTWENLDAARFAPLLIFYAPNLAFYIVKQRAQKDRLATRQKVGIDREGPGILFLYLDDRITIRVLPNWKKSSAAWGNVSASAEKCEPRHDKCLTRVAALTAQHSFTTLEQEEPCKILMEAKNYHEKHD